MRPQTAVHNAAVRPFVQGFRAPFEGLAFVLRRRRLWKYVLIPLAVNVLLFGGLLVAFVLAYPSLIALILPSVEVWYKVVLRVLLWVLGSALLALLFMFTFTAVGNLVAGPFCDLLSERVEGLVRGAGEAPPMTAWAQVREALRGVLDELKRIAFFLAGALLLLLLNLAPVIGTLLATVLGALWAMLFLSLEFSDHYLARHWPRFRDRWGLVWSQRPASIGFGAATALLLLIPMANLVLIPTAVAGATLLWLRLAPPGRDEAPGADPPPEGNPSSPTPIPSHAPESTQ